MGVLGRFAHAVEKEYDRRVRRASEIVAYGMKHGHGHDDHAHEHGHNDTEHSASTPADEEEQGGAEIANVPPGTPMARRRVTEGSPDPHSSEPPTAPTH